MGPTQPITFLGITINTVSNTLILGEDKIKRLKQQLIEFSSREKRGASKQQLKSLAGSLNYACQAVRGERFFLRRILDTCQALKQSRTKRGCHRNFTVMCRGGCLFKVSLTAQCITTMQPKSTFLLMRATRQRARFGVALGNIWSLIVIDLQHPLSTSNYKDICAVVSAVDNRAHKWKGKSVVIHTDSMVTKKGGVEMHM